MQLRSKAWKLGRALAVSTVGPLPALACPNCYAASGPRVLLMYYLSAVGLSLMPFAIIGAIAALTVFLKRQLRHDAQEPLPAETNP